MWLMFPYLQFTKKSRIKMLVGKVSLSPSFLTYILYRHCTHAYPMHGTFYHKRLKRVNYRLRQEPTFAKINKIESMRVFLSQNKRGPCLFKYSNSEFGKKSGRPLVLKFVARGNRERSQRNIKHVQITIKFLGLKDIQTAYLHTSSLHNFLKLQGDEYSDYKQMQKVDFQYRFSQNLGVK